MRLVVPFIESELIEWLESEPAASKQVFPALTKFPLVEEKIILILDGVLHLGNDSRGEQLILTYLKGCYLLDLDALFEGMSREIYLISDTEVQVIEMERDIFLKHTQMKPSYMEQILISHAKVLSKIYTESSKNYKKTSSRVRDSFENLYNEGMLMKSDTESSWYEFPRFLTKKNIANYSQISRKTLDMEIYKLEKKGILGFSNNKMLIKPQSL